MAGWLTAIRLCFICGMLQRCFCTSLCNIVFRLVKKLDAAALILYLCQFVSSVHETRVHFLHGPWLAMAGAWAEASFSTRANGVYCYRSSPLFVALGGTYMAEGLVAILGRGKQCLSSAYYSESAFVH